MSSEYFDVENSMSRVEKKLYNVEMEECKSIERADIERN